MKESESFEMGVKFQIVSTFGEQAISYEKFRYVTCGELFIFRYHNFWSFFTCIVVIFSIWSFLFQQFTPRTDVITSFPLCHSAPHLPRTLPHNGHWRPCYTLTPPFTDTVRGNHWQASTARAPHKGQSWHGDARPLSPTCCRVSCQIIQQEQTNCTW